MPNAVGSSLTSIPPCLMFIAQVEQHVEQMLLEVDEKRLTPACELLCLVLLAGLQGFDSCEWLA